MLAGWRGHINFKYAKPRRVLIAGQIDGSAIELAAIEKILAFCNFDRRSVREQISKEQVHTRPALAHRDKQPAIVVRDGDVRPGLRILVVEKDELVLRAIARIGQRVIEEFAVIHLLARRHFSRIGISRVEESGVIVLPGNARSTSALDIHWQQFVASRLDHLQIADF